LRIQFGCRQVAHLVFGEGQLDAVVDTSGGANWNGDPLRAPRVGLVEQEMRHVIVTGVDDRSLHPSNHRAVACTLSPRRTSTPPGGTRSRLISMAPAPRRLPLGASR
jgi:hypothetical protein